MSSSATTQNKKVLIVGPTGVGKSTIINQITNSSLTVGDTSIHSSISNVKCSHNGIEYELYDILGWFAAESDSVTDQVITSLNAYKNLKQIIQKLDFGIHLLICVISDKRVTKNDVATIQLFYEHVFGEQVPMVLIVNNKHYKVNQSKSSSSSSSWMEKHEKEINETFGGIFAGKYEMAFPKLSNNSGTAGENEQEEKERISAESKNVFYEKVLQHCLSDGFKTTTTTGNDRSSVNSTPRKLSPLVEIVTLCEKVFSKEEAVAEKEISSALQQLFHIPEQQAHKDALQIIKESHSQ